MLTGLSSDFQADYTPKTQFYKNVVLANLLQLILSLAYFEYNSHLTCMLAAQEYGRFVHKAQPLRVSSEPEAVQKSQPFLSLPWKYGIWMQAAQILLPYLASQAVFLTHINVVDHQGTPTDWSLSKVGCSPRGLLVLAIVGLVTSSVAWSQGALRELPRNMPIAASCSASISAACHPSDTDTAHHLTEVQWGVELGDDGRPLTVSEYNTDGSYDEVGHCAFTSKPVQRPEVGKFYQ